MTQLGMAIGGMIGGWIDPTQVNGPRIGDGANQSSAEGVPIPWVIGTCGWLQGNIVDRSPRREVKKTDDGKGSGTEVNTFEARQDVVLMVCESSEHRESLMTGPLMIKMDGKIVYDMRPNKNFGAQNAKFLRNHTFYNGNESQMPDPTCEAFPHNGVGNTPAYRGVFTVVCRDINLTQYGDRVPTYEFVMVGAGSQDTTTETELYPPTYSRFSNDGMPLIDPFQYYGTVGYRTLPDGSTIGPITEGSISDYQNAVATAGYNGLAPTILAGFMPLSIPGDPKLSIFQPGFDITADVSTRVLYQDRGWASAIDFNHTDGFALASAVPLDGQYHLGNDGWLYIAGPGLLPNHYHVPGTYPSPNLISAVAPLEIWADRLKYFPTPNELPDVPGFYIDGVVKPLPVFTTVTGSYLTLVPEDRDTIPGATSQVFAQYQLGPVMESTDSDNTEAFWEAAALAAGISGTYGVDYPIATGTAIQGVSTFTSVTEDTVGLDTAITRICKRGGLNPANDIDVVDMAGFQLLGYMITQPYNAADCIRPLMTAHTCYGSEYDGKLRFHTHGESIEVVVNPDDFIAGSDETDKNTREQEIEYPRLLSVTAIDPTQDYTARPQVERRISPDVNAIGEEQMQVPIVLMPDPHRQLAAIGMKVSWARAQGKREFSVPYATATGLYLYLVAGKPFALEGKRYIAQNVRLEDGEIHFEAVYDRQSAYTSDVTATPGLPPTSPPSGIGGVTLFAAMNLPTLRPQDAVSGMYVAVDGLLDSWPGCALQMSIDDGASWTTAIGSMTQSSVMGYLTAPIDDQPTSTLSVTVTGGDLNSITDERFADGGNPCAVITAGVAEVLNFKTADEIDTDDYDLTDLGRGGLGTTAAPHLLGDRFVQLDSVYFLPLDASLAGRTIKFRPVTFGTPPESNTIYSAVFEPPTFIIDGGEVT